MKILFTMTGSWGTGSGTVVEALTKHLTSREHIVCVLYPELHTEGAGAREETVQAPEARHEQWEFPVEEDGVELYTFPLMIRDPNPGNVEGAWTFKDLSEDQLALYISSFQKRFQAVAGDFRPDIVECHHIWAMPYAVHELGRPYLAVAHHSDQMAFHFDERMQSYATQAARGAAHIFAVSEGTREEVMDLYEVASERVTVTGNGYDRTVFKPMEVHGGELYAEFNLPIPPEAPVVTFAGKLSRTKGIDTLLLANRIIRSKRKDVHIVVFGAGRLEDALESSKIDLYDRTNVHFVGHQPYADIARFHNAGKLSVMPSRTEGFGIAGLEALGCGRPLVVTRTGGLEDFSVGAVIDPEDEQDLAAEILRITGLPKDHYERLCEDALAAAQKFSWEAITDQRLIHYRDLAQE